MAAGAQRVCAVQEGGHGNTPCTVMGAILYSLTVLGTQRTRIAISAEPRHINKHLFRALPAHTRTLALAVAAAMLLSFSVCSLQLLLPLV